LGIEQEATVRAFVAELEGELKDPDLVERVISRMASDARYQIHAWDDPLVGHDAIRAELLRQALVYRDSRCEIVTIGSAGQTVFTERIDSGIVNDKPLTVHIVGVFEVDADGKIAAWRDYMDSREIAVQVGAITAEQRPSAP
jgi:limonene-1,2-epoxide hydrolase